jgi:hypothetical protein
MWDRINSFYKVLTTRRGSGEKVFNRMNNPKVIILPNHKRELIPLDT